MKINKKISNLKPMQNDNKIELSPNGKYKNYTIQYKNRNLRNTKKVETDLSHLKFITKTKIDCYPTDKNKKNDDYLSLRSEQPFNYAKFIPHKTKKIEYKIRKINDWYENKKIPHIK